MAIENSGTSPEQHPHGGDDAAPEDRPDPASELPDDDRDDPDTDEQPVTGHGNLPE
ncbi:hypothetical protein GCM10010472_68500 [Pseudonocardia halophobica]|uniref:Uncharacterized protein n=1 Tax=Pseudonocardia halophobica TaxID=29401 RepID=A0A9W6NXF5_9PSEU|nr:hypothetical protein [Pseudonocardia halophobica]GLL12581.1 hypothetical protein GCM10017577_37220 [Pseudonocardia halophobica]